MINDQIEEFYVKKCPLCTQAHKVKMNVYREMLPNDMNKDIRVPEFKKVSVRLVCPEQNEVFTQDFYIQEDVYSRVKKITKPGAVQKV